MDLNEKKIQEIIQKEYGFSISNIEKLNLGFDVNTMVLKISSSEQKQYFLKIRTKDFSESCINIPFWLSQKAGLKNIIDPVETQDKELYVKKSSAHFMLYPYINGKSGWDVSMSKEQFTKFGGFLKKLHSEKIPDKYLKNVFKYEHNYEYIEMVKNYLNSYKKLSCNDSIISDFLAAFETYQSKISEIINYSENTVNKVSCENICLCHGDIHAGNLLIGENDLYIVDWDTMTLAPKEKDLMYIGGGIGGKWNKDDDIKKFYAGYGQENEINKNLIKYFRCNRIIQDIYFFIKEITDIQYGNERRNSCVGIFKNLFGSGNVVEMALKI